MNPTSCGYVFDENYSTITYGRSSKNSKGSSASSARPNSGYADSSDDVFSSNNVYKSENTENLHSNIHNSKTANLMREFANN